jgi:uncharacterized membrane protein
MAAEFKLRIENLSDLVFGFALSLGGIVLLNLSINQWTDVVRGLFWFSFGFLVLIGMWMTYSQIMSKVKLETPGAMYFNILLLLMVVLEPYLLNLLAFDQSLDRAIGTTLYAIDLALIWLIMAAMYHIAIKQNHPDSPSLRVQRDLRIVHSGIFLLSILPFFWTVSVGGLELRYIAWFMAWPVGYMTEKALILRFGIGAKETV